MHWLTDLSQDACTLAVPNYLSLVVLNVRCVACPGPNAERTAYGLCFVSTDALIVTTPIPLLWKVKLTITRKLAVSILLCSGVFIMVATILRCVLSLQDINGINVSTIWAVRETVSFSPLPSMASRPTRANIFFLYSSWGLSLPTPPL